MLLSIDRASPADADAIAALQTRVAEDLTRLHGIGHWSAPVAAYSVARAVVSSTVFVAREGPAIVGTVRLVARKPWAIDPVYFTQVARPVYLLSMAVEPVRQRAGIGRQLLEAARAAALQWPADTIRLDAYDHPAGAGPFYVKGGYREVGRVTYRRVPLIYYELMLP